MLDVKVGNLHLDTLRGRRRFVVGTIPTKGITMGVARKRLEVFIIWVGRKPFRYEIETEDDIDRMGLIHEVLAPELDRDEYVMAIAAETLALMRDLTLTDSGVIAADRLAELCETRAEFDQINGVVLGLQASRRTYIRPTIK